ncbi:MAG: hypothetical protein IJS08_05435 [Victivallales bacterium]|nr:hypothetical protein [Victivallales bacterium]
MSVTMNAVSLYAYDDTMRNDDRFQNYDAINAQYNMYTVAGVKDESGNLRKLSMSELVMVVCLARAQEKEEAVIDIMRELSNNTYLLEILTEIEERRLNGEAISNIKPKSGGTWQVDTDGNGTTESYANASALLQALGINPNLGTDDLLTEIESKMDSLNSFSQEKMIELQSETNKRDQAYDIITNVLKSLQNVLTGISNNI